MTLVRVLRKSSSDFFAVDSCLSTFSSWSENYPNSVFTASKIFQTSLLRLVTASVRKPI